MRTPTLLLAWIVLLAAPAAWAAGPLGYRLGFDAGAAVSPAPEGSLRVREFSREGEFLDLRDDLGVRAWVRLHIETAFRAWPRHSFRVGFTWNLYSGAADFDHDVWNDGTLYGAGTRVDFGRSFWWRLEGWYGYSAFQTSQLDFAVMGGILVDALDARLQPDRKPIGTKQEVHEAFYAQLMPVPALGARLDWSPLPWLQLRAQASAGWMNHLPTWYHEGGRIYHSQTTLDGEGGVSVRYHELAFGLDVAWRSLSIDDESQEDHNRFAVRGLLLGLHCRIQL